MSEEQKFSILLMTPADYDALLEAIEELRDQGYCYLEVTAYKEVK